jgi:dienelactone hydrolase
MIKLGFLGFAIALFGSANGQVMGGPLDYKVGTTDCQGYVAVDTMKSGKRPGILIIHDWNGIDAYEQGRAAQLAKLGYVAMCADIYGKGVRPKNAQESGAQASKYKSDRALFRERLMGALEVLKKDPNVDPNKVAAIGYCFGGTGVLELARMGADLRGVVSFHGGLDANPDMKAGPVIPSVLVLHGADDPFVPPAQVSDFRKEFAQAKMEFVAYPGAVHAFTEPNAGNDKSTGAAYNKAADEGSWAKMKAFFSEIFK